MELGDYLSSIKTSGQGGMSAYMIRRLEDTEQ